MNKRNVTFENDYVFAFTTIGYVKATLSPSINSTQIPIKKPDIKSSIKTKKLSRGIATNIFPIFMEPRELILK
jgi:hypothetical protein